MAPVRDLVLHLDADDDYASVRSRLDASGARHVAVVIAPRCRQLRSVVALRILRSFADDAGLDLSVISSDGAVRQLARDLGLRALSSLGALERHRRIAEALGELPAPVAWLLRASAAIGKALVVLALAAAAFALPFYLFLPQMVVRLTPAGQEVVERIELRADPLVRTPSSATGQIPARGVQVELEGTERAEATGRKDAPGAAAQGTVTFANRAQQPVRVPQGTVLRATTGARFVTAVEIEVPGGLLATAQAPVVSLRPGPEGNAAPLQVTQIEGPVAEQLAVTNERPIGGGAVRQAAIVIAEDLERAKQALFNRLERQAANELMARRREGEVLPTETIRVSALGQQDDRVVGEEADAVVTRMRVRATGTAFATQDVSTVLGEVLRARGKELAPAAPSLRTRPPEILRVDGQSVVFALQFSGMVQSQINTRDLEPALRWLTADEAREYLSGRLTLARPPQVDIRPDWATRALRVQVVVEPPARGASGLGGEPSAR